VDDYAVDKIERNDQSFIFVLKMRDRTWHDLRLYPTLIRGCHASRAKGIHALSISGKMKELCAAFGTHARWNEGQQWLEIGEFEPEKSDFHADLKAGG